MDSRTIFAIVAIVSALGVLAMGFAVIPSVEAANDNEVIKSGFTNPTGESFKCVTHYQDGIVKNAHCNRSK